MTIESYIKEKGYKAVTYSFEKKKMVPSAANYSTYGPVSVVYYPPGIYDKVIDGTATDDERKKGISYGLNEVGRGPRLIWPIPFILRQIEDDVELKRIYEVSGGSVMPKDVDRGIAQHGCEAVFDAIINNKVLIIEPEPEMSWQ
jgi:hypothetical protein